MNSIVSLVRLAKLVRNQLEIFVANEDGPKDLGGYCGIASYTLLKRAQDYNLNCNLVYGSFLQYNRIFDRYYLYSGHVWVECEGRIVDITATQFSKVKSKIKRNFDQKIYVCQNTNPHYNLYSKDNEAIEEIDTWYEEPLVQLEKEISSIVDTRSGRRLTPAP